MSPPAPESATSRVPRLLTMVPWLVNRQGIDLESAAAEFGITVAQLRSDLELLFMCGYGSMTDEMIDVEVEDGRIYITNADTIARPLRLGRSEALTLIVGLRALVGTAGVTDSDVVERTLAKLEAAAGGAPEDSPPVAAVIDDASASHIRGIVTDALKRHRRLHLSYLVPARDESTERDVDPMRLLNLEGRWYLEGWCHRAEDTRLFRLDRIETAAVLDADGTAPAAATARDLDAGTFVPRPGDRLVTLAVDPAWEWVAEYYPVEERRTGPGGLQVTMRVGDPGLVIRLALRSGGGVVVLDPADLAARVEADARAALAAYDDPAQGVAGVGAG